MYEFRVHTLVDITQNSKLQQQFPFAGDDGELIHNKDTLQIAKNQNSNFNTLIQLLQIRGNITWEEPPIKIKNTLALFLSPVHLKILTIFPCIYTQLSPPPKKIITSIME